MQLYNAETLMALVTNAATLVERMAWGQPNAVQPSVLVDSLLDRWQRAVGGDPARFLRRLALDGLTLDQARVLLAAPPLLDSAPLPRWAHTFHACLEQVAHILPEPARYIQADAPVPFEGLLRPFVDWASMSLQERNADRWPILADAAVIALERHLLARLSTWASLVLFQAFCAFRKPRQPGFEPLAQFMPGPHTTGLYREFVAVQLGSGLADLLGRYPMLARLLATLVDQWIDASTELFERLAADWALIQDTFNQGNWLRRVEALLPGLSDPHRGGRTTAILVFDTGLRLVYKPKSLAIDAAFGNLVNWLNEVGAANASAPLSYALRPLHVLNRGEYGWAEYLEAAPCSSEAEVRRYYHRAGMLAGVLYAIRGTDIHSENLIAMGEHPMIIDLEMLLLPDVRDLAPGADTSALFFPAQILTESVLTSGLFSGWYEDPNGDQYDVAGLGAPHRAGKPRKAPRWYHINTDHMAYRLGSYEEPPVLNNVVTLNSSPVPPTVYLGDIEAGFREMVTLLLARRDDFLKGPLAALARCPARFVIRPTTLYGKLLQRLARPDAVENGIAFSLQLETLSRALLLAETDHPLWGAFRYERAALTQGDVPHFTYLPTHNSLILTPGNELPGVFKTTGYQAACQRLESLSGDDLEFQVNLIRGALVARFQDVTPSAAPPAVPTDPGACPPADRDLLLRHACAIAERIMQRAIRGKHGLEWIQLEYFPQRNLHLFQPMSFSLYAGKIGVALFLAALEKTVGGYRGPALQALQSVQAAVADTGVLGQIACAFGIGGYSGLGSLAYGLAEIGRLLDMPALLDQASTVTAQITPEAIDADKTLDIIGGCAGAILGLLKVHRLRPDPALLDMAIRCGQRLLVTREAASPGSPCAWRTLDNELLTGFAHGAAGMGYALAWLYGATGDPAFRDAAAEAFAYEQSVFDVTAQNWPDFRQSQRAEDGKPGFMWAWCHGAPGIGLARLASLPWLDDNDRRAQMRIGIQGAHRPEMLAYRDHLCCGSSGRIDILAEAARRLDRPDLMDAALRSAAWMLDRADSQGHFALPGDGQVDGFSLFQGLSGIGYSLLRLAYPDQLSSLLLLE